MHVPSSPDILHASPGDLSEVTNALGRHDSTEELGKDDLVLIKLAVEAAT